MNREMKPEISLTELIRPRRRVITTSHKGGVPRGVGSILIPVRAYMILLQTVRFIFKNFKIFWKLADE